ncbi:MAG: hypothetical protein QM820_18575 [Minicystis sp.]
MSAVDLQRALPSPLALRLPRSRAGLAGRLRALSAARLAVAIFLGGSVQPVTTDVGDSRRRHRPVMETDGVAAA